MPQWLKSTFDLMSFWFLIIYFFSKPDVGMEHLPPYSATFQVVHAALKLTLSEE